MNSPLVLFLAEDNPGDVLLVRQALREHRLEFELFVAPDGDKLDALLRRVGKEVPAPDVLLLDLNIPRADGPELFRRVRSHPLCADAPLIVFSSSDSPRDRSWTSEFRVSRYFRKPSEWEEFMKLGEVVREVAGQA